MRGHRHNARGFTLVELVVTLVIAAIITAFVATMITSPVDAYIAQSRRAELSGDAETALRRISVDVAQSLPNSLRTGTIGSLRILEVIPVLGMASYRETWPERTAMRFGTPVSNFSVLENLTLPASPLPLQVVVDNRRTAGRTAYGLTNVITPSTTTIGVATTGAGTDITISPAFRFILYADRSANQRAYLVSTVTRYECDLGTGVLRRYDSLPIRNTLTTVTAASTTIARDITACTFQPVAGNGQHGGMAIVEITVSRAVAGNSTERLRMVRQIRVENPS